MIIKQLPVASDLSETSYFEACRTLDVETHQPTLFSGPEIEDVAIIVAMKYHCYRVTTPTLFLGNPCAWFVMFGDTIVWSGDL